MQDGKYTGIIALQRCKTANPSKSSLCNVARWQIHRNHRFVTLQDDKSIEIIALQCCKTTRSECKSCIEISISIRTQILSAFKVGEIMSYQRHPCSNFERITNISATSLRKTFSVFWLQRQRNDVPPYSLFFVLFSAKEVRIILKKEVIYPK
jgi:hypothetical protein